MTSKRNYGAAFKAELQKQESPYAFYGTPLPALDDHTRDDGSYVPVWKQEVTDERGRKRLHGAFTGGYSAGYFNTVGSKEGWTPSTFVSSRQNRMKDSKTPFQQRPEDFMDEEDVREAEESKILSTKDEFSAFGSTEEETRRRDGFFDLLRPVGETKGVQLLRRMGWREGQGIGPKIRRKIKTDEGDDDDEEGEYHMFAPENPALIAFVRKTDHKGLGYGGEERLESRVGLRLSHSGSKSRDQSSDEEDELGPAFTAPKFKKKTKEPVRKSAFGVGILNDTGSDDEDPYEMGPKISYNRTIGGNKQKKKKDSLVGSNPLLKAKPTFVSKKALGAKSSSGFRKCHDGRYPMEGFILSTQLDTFASISLDDDSVKPPEVPKDWKSSKTPQHGLEETSYVSTSDAARASTLDAKARAALLGESQLPGKSVFDFLTPAARERIAQVSGKTDLPVALGEKPPPGFEVSEEDRQRGLEALVPQLSPDDALLALSRGVGGWMPYAEDESKRARYRTFLEIRAGLQQGLPPRPDDMSRDNWVAEMNEFARAAQVFKPVTGMMASRFTSSTQQAQSSSSDAAGNSLLNQPASKPEDPAEQAARMGMFGPLTRSISNFYPTRLLCKRFNVKPPANVAFAPDSNDSSGPASSASASNVSFGASRFQSGGYQLPPDLVTMDNNTTTTTNSSSNTSTTVPQQQATTSEANQQQTHQPTLVMAPDVIDSERNEALEAERPGEAVFKAIFGSDDEDED